MTGCSSCWRARSSPSPPDLSLLRDVAAAPRATGSDAIASARARCIDELGALGFRVDTQVFEFSAAPGTWGTPVVALLAGLLVAVVVRLGATGTRFAPFIAWLAGVAALGVIVRLLTVHGVSRLPWMRRHGVNVVATRGERPAVWLTAHLDTKSQPVPTLVRSAAVVVGVCAIAVAGVLCATQALGAGVSVRWWLGDAIGAAIGLLPLATCVAGNRSPGAFDNASGVATAIEAARQLDAPRLGVLLTDAEELGLAGARAHGRAADLAGRVLLNCDGVDDHGAIVAMHGGARPRGLAETIARAASSCGVRCDVRRLLPGVLTDSVAFADAGGVSVTLSRGSLASLARIHRRGDDLAHLSGTGIADTARLMAEIARLVEEQPERQWKS